MGLKPQDYKSYNLWHTGVAPSPHMHSFHAIITIPFYHFNSNCWAHHSSHGEQVGMVAALLQVHHDVEQGHLVPSAFGVQSLEVSRQNELVIFPAGQRKQEESGEEMKVKTTISYFRSFESHVWQIHSLKLDPVIKSP